MISVYLVCAEIGDEKLYKIGFTRRKIEKRVKELKVGNGADFRIVNSFQSKWGTKIESILHRFYKNKKVNGEWFLLDKSDINDFYKTCNEIHNNLELVSNNSLYYKERGNF